jgi:hypothetical protein
LAGLERFLRASLDGGCMFTSSHISHRGTCFAVAAAAALATAAPATAGYGWPVKPFHQQHPVRGFFGDPRIGIDGGVVKHTLHFGIDVAAPNGTPVYATISGRVSLNSLHSDVVLVESGGTTFEYWHIVPAVRGGYAVAYKTVVGRIEAPWAHVHFSERHGSTYVNPLRPGALSPYRDTTRPTIRALRIERDGRDIVSHAFGGAVDLVLDAYDTTPMDVPPPWNGLPVSPALVEWRLRGPQIASTGWSVGADFRTVLPSAPFGSIYAPVTRQNHADAGGCYRYVLARGWDTRKLSAGSYVLQARVVDTGGNAATTSLPLTVSPRHRIVAHAVVPGR